MRVRKQWTSGFGILNSGFFILLPSTFYLLTSLGFADSIRLTWDPSTSPWLEGYNVYQGETEAGPWTKIATFDVDNDVALIYKDEFDPNVGGKPNKVRKFNDIILGPAFNRANGDHAFLYRI